MPITQNQCYKAKCDLCDKLFTNDPDLDSCHFDERWQLEETLVNSGWAEVVRCKAREWWCPDCPKPEDVT
ncbi:hypothetical protein LCGC14_1448080 [marine sediment metagenome]|uniref:Uncharacterized protein n=1 Tax=marine sediment metagenome TaxID=412755 RepID=A0A0F9MKH6_9ZZZZ